MASRSRWRKDRLLILGYHGIAQHDEHQWNPALFITPRLLDDRLYTLKAAGFTILPLGEALTRLHAGTLSERSVAITFDDGFVDFSRLAAPILRAHNAQATVYLTTYYSERRLPVPGITAAYIVWMSSAFAGPLRSVPGYDHVDLRNPAIRRQASEAIGRYFTGNRNLRAAEKHAMLEGLAAELDFDLTSMQERRLMHLMSTEEVRNIASLGFDIQLHTHTHWAPPVETIIRREIEDNRERIEAITGRPATHFCYPGGVHYPLLRSWLKGLRIESGTTCTPGLVSAGDDPLMLPRFIDHSRVTHVEFEAWVSGVASMLPRRPVDDEPQVAAR